MASNRLFAYRSRIAAPADEVFRWHARQGAFARLAPPWMSVRELGRTGGIEAGARATLELRLGFFRLRWVVEHRDFVEGCQFRDVQLAGPFAHWDHLHRVEADEPGACVVEDRVEYRLPFDTIAGPLLDRFVRRSLERLFAYRHSTVALDLAVHRTYASCFARPQRIAVTGASGLVGSALCAFLSTGGHEVRRVVRAPAPGPAGELWWDPETGNIGGDAWAGVDAVVHLAGENLAAARWSAEVKDRILRSRAEATRLLSQALARQERLPGVFVSASAVGYYGNRGDEVLRETDPPGAGFLARVCREWEAAAQPLVARGVRVVHVRAGVVLSAAGGALFKMLPAFRLGLGGRIGSGRQYLSWIALEDILGVIVHVLANDSLRGPVNAVAGAVTNAEFARTLGRVLGRPARFPVPSVVARVLFGEMADEMLLASARVEPARLRETGYRFLLPDLESALRRTLGRFAPLGGSA